LPLSGALRWVDPSFSHRRRASGWTPGSWAATPMGTNSIYGFYERIRRFTELGGSYLEPNLHSKRPPRLAGERLRPGSGLAGEGSVESRLGSPYVESRYEFECFFCPKLSI